MPRRRWPAALRAGGSFALSLASACAQRTTVSHVAPGPLSAAPVSVDTTSFEVYEATIVDMQKAMAAGRVSSQALVEAYLRRIAAFDHSGPALNTILRLNPNAVAEAMALDEERKAKGPRGMLHGIPIVLKDNYDTRDLPATAGSISLAGMQPTTDGFVAARLRAAGAVLLGKSNMMEFALGVYTASSIGGDTRNPYDPTRSPGGSSGGSAAAVAASLTAVAWGTDTCGSIRVPAAFNALFGLRPTKGITSTQGIVPLCHSQDVSGALARTASDLAIALDASIALDPGDAASARWSADSLPRFVASLDSNALRGARLGVLKEFFGTGDGERGNSIVVRVALEQMRAAGAELVDVSVPGLDTLSANASVVSFEFRNDLAGYLRRHPGAPVASIGDILGRGLYLDQLRDVLKMLSTSPDTSSPAYRATLQKRADLAAKLRQIMVSQRLDALVYPTVRRGPNLVGDPQLDPNCETSANSGFPALSVPAGFGADEIPVGMELLGLPLSDARLLAIGYAWERRASPRRAPLYTPPLQLKSAPPPVQVRVVIQSDSMKATADFMFSAVTGRLTWSVSITGLPAQQLLAVSLHQADDTTKEGPVIVPIAPPGSLTSGGSIVLPLPARLALHEGRLYLTVSTASHPGGSLRAPIPVPSGPPIVRPTSPASLHSRP